MLDQLGYLDFQVEVELAASSTKKEGVESCRNCSDLECLPLWMITEGMNLAKEQRGETSNTSNGDEKSEGKDRQEQDAKEDVKTIQVSQLSIEHRMHCTLGCRIFPFHSFYSFIASLKPVIHFL